MNWGASLAGLIVGTLVGMTGVGGGSLMAPVLILVLGVTPLRAIGSDLAYAAITKAVGAWQHARAGSVDYRVAGWLALGSVPSALLAVAVASHLPAGLSTEHVVTTVLGGVLLLAAAAMLVCRRMTGKGPPASPWLLTPIGFVVGALVALTSVGSGCLVIAALTLATPLTARRAVGTDVLHAMLLTCAAALAHWSIGTVDMALTASLHGGSIPGVILGSRLPARAPEQVMRVVLASTLALAGTQLLRAASRTSSPEQQARGAESARVTGRSRPVFPPTAELAPSMSPRPRSVVFLASGRPRI